MMSFIKKLFASDSAVRAYKVPGTLEGVFEFRAARITGELKDRHDLKSCDISVFVTKGGKDVLSTAAQRIGKTNRYRFEILVNGAFHPAELITEKVTLVARSTMGATGNLRLGGASGLELIRDYLGVPAECICDIDFTRGGNSREFLGKGWSHPEKEFTWTVDDDSFVKLPAISEPGNYAIRMVTAAFIAQPFVPSQFAELFLNGEFLWGQSFNASFNQFIEIKFPGELLIGQHLELRINHPDAARPSDVFPTNQDNRRLALNVRRLTLVRFL